MCRLNKNTFRLQYNINWSDFKVNDDEDDDNFSICVCVFFCRFFLSSLSILFEVFLLVRRKRILSSLKNENDKNKNITVKRSVQQVESVWLVEQVEHLPCSNHKMR